ncbi:MAG: hypothetical protein J6Z31_00620 [Fibrobacter sp.]|nr:hypothetical protein [Fibrobacter sp.]
MSHLFHIPVMGTCFTTDTPLRVAHLGVDSAISLVDDKLLEKIGFYYAQKFGMPYESAVTEHSRAKRIQNFLNLVNALVQKKFGEVLQEPFTGESEKDLYFKILPTNDPLRLRYKEMLTLPEGAARSREEDALTAEMRPGSIDVNIMVKLDRPGFDDAKEALRGYAESDLCKNTSLILSAGINQALFSEMENFPCFYRNASGSFDKKIILKISDFRSAEIQGKFLARKGLEVSEYRIESGLNCGGHLFPAEGELLPLILQEVAEKKEKFVSGLTRTVQKYYEAHGLDSKRLLPHVPKWTAQGGIGNFGEMERLLVNFGMDRCGIGSPFLLVPEATLVDPETRALLANAKLSDIQMSLASPLDVPFSLLKTCGAEADRLEKIAEGRPGSPCPKGFLQNNSEFSQRPICTASREYQKKKLEEIEAAPISCEEKAKKKNRILEKMCICHELGNSALIALGMESAKSAPPAICPGPNLAFFDGIYTFEEMVNFFYGRGKVLAKAHRPHMFALEILLYAKWFKTCVDEQKPLQKIAANLKRGLDFAQTIAESKAFPGENLESIRDAIARTLPLIEPYL